MRVEGPDERPPADSDTRPAVAELFPRARGGKKTRHTLTLNVLRFSRFLREFELEVTPGRAINAIDSLQHIDIGNRRDFYVALRANFVSRREDLEKFDRAFAAFWGTEDGDAPFQPQELKEESDADGDTKGEESNQKQIALLEDNEAGEPGDVGDADSIPGYSPDDVIARKDFATFTDDEVAQMRKLIMLIAPKIATSVSRRKKVDSRGDEFDPRRTLRWSLRHGGEIFDLARRKRRIRKNKLILLCDVSGSMDAYSRLLIQFVYALQNQLRGVETFVFSTKLHRVTHLLRGKPIDQGLDLVSEEVKEWSGGTSIGTCLRDFNTKYGRTMLNSRSVVLIISDGWDRGDTKILEEAMQHLHRNGKRVFWLNPLLGSPHYQPLCKGMKAALPYTDFFLPVHNLNSLVDLARTLKTL